MVGKQADRRARAAAPARGANRRREGRHPGLAELADSRVPARARASRADPARRAAQVHAPHGRRRDPLGRRAAPAPLVRGRVRGQRACAARARGRARRVTCCARRAVRGARRTAHRA